MAWITLSLRKQSLKAETNDLELQDLTLSREKRSIQRNLAYQKSIMQSQENSEISAAKEEYNKVKKERPMAGSFNGETYYFKTRSAYDAQYDKYKKLSGNSKKNFKPSNTITKENYDKVKEDWDKKNDAVNQDYKEAAEDIKTYYDSVKEDLEEEATDRQTQIEEEQTVVETNLQDINQELSSVSEQIGTDIQSSAIKFT